MKHKLTLIKPALSLAALLGCAAFLNAEPANQNPNIHLGPEVPMGHGTIQTYTLLNPAGKPVEVGVYFTASALEALPTGPSDGTWDILDAADNLVSPCCGHEFFLEFPAEVQPYIPFQYTIVNWNPEGHAPPGVYNAPHFDFHFYTFPNEERLTIEAPLDTERCIVDGNLVPLTCEDFETAMKPIPADQFPPGYANVGAVEPGMGNHLLDFTSHEWHEIAFDHTWIFGIYDGRMIFWEPMITHEFLTSLRPGKENKGPKQVNIPISTPQAAPEAGYYPTKYQIAYHPGLDGYTVSLTSMEWLPQSSGK